MKTEAQKNTDIARAFGKRVEFERIRVKADRDGKKEQVSR